MAETKIASKQRLNKKAKIMIIVLSVIAAIAIRIESKTMVFMICGVCIPIFTLDVLILTAYNQL